MTDRDEAKADKPLVEHWLERTGVKILLDKGFRPGMYSVYVHYDGLADKIGFQEARRFALEQARRLRSQWAATGGYAVEAVRDGSRTGDPDRKHDEDYSFTCFDIMTKGRRWHHAAAEEDFRLALLRAEQARDQSKARRVEERRNARRAAFQGQLEELLAGEAYAHLDGATKERLLAEVPALAFPGPGFER